MSASGNDSRLADGGLIDRRKPLRFRFDEREFQGFAGDTLASALLANGVRLVARSFKYHRPRGILSAGSEEPNALVELRGGPRREPNTRATVIELYDGLEATSQNRWPSLEFDVQAINGWFAPLFVAGFYYKTFMWPAKFWEKVYEPLIRRAAGLGRASLEADPDHCDKCWTHCDVLVIGGGPAGLSAALAAARSGARVVIADEDFVLGGRCIADRRSIDGKPSAAWAAEAVEELRSMPHVRVLRRTTVFGTFDDGVYGAVEKVNDHLPVPPAFEPRQRLWRIVAKQAVLASGSIERPLVFGNNDLPGVMLAGAVRAYVNRYAACPGRRAVVFTDNDDGWTTARDLVAAGVAVAAVVDPREEAVVAALARQIPDVEAISGEITGARGGRAVQARRGDPSQGVVASHRLRPRRRLRRLVADAASHVAPRAAPALGRSALDFRARAAAGRYARGRRGQWGFHAARGLAARAAARTRVGCGGGLQGIAVGSTPGR